MYFLLQISWCVSPRRVVVALSVGITDQIIVLQKLLHCMHISTTLRCAIVAFTSVKMQCNGMYHTSLQLCDFSVLQCN